MKTARLFLAVIALVFAFASAFALRASSAVEEPSLVIDGVCTKVQNITCGGGTHDCQISGNTYRAFQAGTSCGAVLKMTP